jgi:hypothetical protein
MWQAYEWNKAENPERDVGHKILVSFKDDDYISENNIYFKILLYVVGETKLDFYSILYFKILNIKLKLSLWSSVKD